MNPTSVCILGGTGFVGRHLVARLESGGTSCRVLTRNPQRYRDLQTGGLVELMKTDPFDAGQLEPALNGCGAAINLVGILNENGTGNRFHRIHVELGDRLLDGCRAAGVDRLLHMSALNANEANGPSLYLKTKGEAENRALTLGQPQIKVTSFRPSVIFGHDDSFFNRFANLLQQLPGPFPLACPDARFAPVYVGDVAEAFARALDCRATWGKHYELCGPESFSLKQLVQYTARQLDRKGPVLGLSDTMSRVQARLLGLLPGKPFSYDNYLSLQIDSICGQDGLAELGIDATPIDAVVPYYLAGKAERARYQRLRQVI